jgi:hypothetical protein
MRLFCASPSSVIAQASIFREVLSAISQVMGPDAEKDHVRDS